MEPKASDDLQRRLNCPSSLAIRQNFEKNVFSVIYRDKRKSGSLGKAFLDILQLLLSKQVDNVKFILPSRLCRRAQERMIFKFKVLKASILVKNFHSIYLPCL